MWDRDGGSLARRSFSRVVVPAGGGFWYGGSVKGSLARAVHRGLDVRHGLLALALAASTGACGWDYTPSENALPTPAGETSMGDSEGPTLPDPTETEGLADVPATYRFDCVDIQQLGDADDTVFQVATLQDTWANDISSFNLSILIDLLEEDEAGGSATVQIRSGVGTNWGDLCGEPSTISNEAVVTFEPGVTKYEPVPDGTEDQCSQPADAGASTGTYTLAFGKEDIINIYAEAPDGTPFNCALDGAPPAIPVAGVSATITLSEDRAMLSGTLTGCMTESSAMQRCSCLGFCAGNPNDNCPGCPNGAIPLAALLGGISSTQHCTDLMGETAFDITLAFTARRLAAVPAVCG